MGFMRFERAGLSYPEARVYVISSFDTKGEVDHVDAVEWGQNGELCGAKMVLTSQSLVHQPKMMN